jgi:hypothetical protein
MTLMSAYDFGTPVKCCASESGAKARLVEVVLPLVRSPRPQVSGSDSGKSV